MIRQTIRAVTRKIDAETKGVPPTITREKTEALDQSNPPRRDGHEARTGEEATPAKTSAVEPTQKYATTAANGKLATADPAALTPHPLNAELFGSAAVSTVEQEAFEEDVAAYGVTKPLVVTGLGCASPPNTILAGHRRRDAGVKAKRLTVPAIRVEGLSEFEELEIMVRDNIADQHTRRLTEQQLWTIERRVRESHGKQRGQRTDLHAGEGAGSAGPGATNLDGEPSRSRRPKTSELIAKLVGQTPTAVADREKIFTSPVAAPALKAAVNAGELSRTAAVNLIRATELELGEKIDEPVACDVARKKLEAHVAQQATTNRGGKKVAKKKRTPAAPTRPTNVALDELVRNLEGCAETLGDVLHACAADADVAEARAIVGDVAERLASADLHAAIEKLVSRCRAPESS